MSKMASFLEGMALGMVAGMGVIIAGKMIVDNNKQLTKGKNKLEKAVIDFVDGVQTMIK